MLKLDTTPKLYTQEQAEEIAANMNQDEFDDWDYVADHDPKGAGYSRVAVYEESELVCYL